MIDLGKEHLLKIADVAERFNVHRRTVESWMGNGLESLRMGRLVYTSVEALERFSQPRDLEAEQEARERASAKPGRRQRRAMDEAARRHGLVE
jgi:hypothetical protein